MNLAASIPPPSATERAEIRCTCGHLIFNGEVLKCRILRLKDGGAEAKCNKCKQWVDVPLSLDERRS